MKPNGKKLNPLPYLPSDKELLYGMVWLMKLKETESERFHHRNNNFDINKI